MGDVFLRRLSRWQADQYRDQLADLHVAAYDGAAHGVTARDAAPVRDAAVHDATPVRDGAASAEPHGRGAPVPGPGHGPGHREPYVEPFHSRSRFRERLAEHSARPGFDLVIADSGGRPVGCAYGYPLPRDSDRWHGFAGPVPGQLAELTAAGRVFAVAELVVTPRERRRGIGRRLHDRLLSGSGAALAVLLLSPADAHATAAEAARRSWGWQPAGRVRLPAAGDVGDALEVFVRPLRR
ncbi:GNAT family N-acetyltransferase [Streptomyces sp. VNUA116]|uniref:GNAT family N-acetyltransferase n=1 Tax=Streptomyces sp. VNUA116 TaxID=3062449 RepID=UPI00267745F2|nr:GNAT family N-acetyltransferase [Streptomyces sp. VNUA116]WKU45714.1 GNAT family N-acetyltransferase [Streptomyces sp. VNUA116]